MIVQHVLRSRKAGKEKETHDVPTENKTSPHTNTPLHGKVLLGFVSPIPIFSQAIHELDKKLGEHLVYCKGQWIAIANLEKDINGNNGDGIKHQHKILWDDREEKRGMTSEIKVAIIISVINGLMTAGSIFNII